MIYWTHKSHTRSPIPISVSFVLFVIIFSVFWTIFFLVLLVRTFIFFHTGWNVRAHCTLFQLYRILFCSIAFSFVFSSFFFFFFFISNELLLFELRLVDGSVIRKTQLVIFNEFVCVVKTYSKRQMQLFSFRKFSLLNHFFLSFSHSEFVTLLLTLYLIINFPFGILNGTLVCSWASQTCIEYIYKQNECSSLMDLQAKIKQSNEWKQFLIFHYQLPVGLAAKMIYS